MWMLERYFFFDFLMNGMKGRIYKKGRGKYEVDFVFVYL